jgi:hypothetical protein
VCCTGSRATAGRPAECTRSTQAREGAERPIRLTLSRETMKGSFWLRAIPSSCAGDTPELGRKRLLIAWHSLPFGARQHHRKPFARKPGRRFHARPGHDETEGAPRPRAFCCASRRSAPRGRLDVPQNCGHAGARSVAGHTRCRRDANPPMEVTGFVARGPEPVPPVEARTGGAGEEPGRPRPRPASARGLH